MFIYILHARTKRPYLTDVLPNLAFHLAKIVFLRDRKLQLISVSFFRKLLK